MNSLFNNEALSGISEAVTVRKTIAPAEISKWWGAMKQDGQPVEIRLLQQSAYTDKDGSQKEGKATYSGVFCSAAEVVEALQSCNLAGVYGVYFTLNALDEAAARRKSWGAIKKAAKGDTVNDSEITHRDWLLVDFDPERTAGSSATDKEKEKAVEVAQTVLDFFNENGLTSPTIIADSGNGLHFLWRLDMDNTPEDTRTVETFLKSLSAKFSTDTVKIDTTVSNASRICKLYGTTAAKGENTTERPHRLARIIKVMDGQAPLTREGLTALTVTIGGEVVQESPASTNAPESPQNGQETASVSMEHTDRPKRRESMEQTLKKVESCLHQMERANLRFSRDYDKWDAIFFGFAHSLGEKGRTLAMRFSALCEGSDPEQDGRKYTEHIASRRGDESTIASFFDLAAKYDIYPSVCWWDYIHKVEDELPDPKALIRRDGEIIIGRENLCIIAGLPKRGKSHLLVALLAAAMNGGSNLGFVAEEPAKVLLADTEQSIYHLDAEVKRILRLTNRPQKDCEFLTALHLRALSPRERLEAIKAAAEELQPDIIAIDGAGDLVANINDLEESESAVEELLRLSSRQNAGIIAVLHTSWSKEGKLVGHLGSILERKSQTVLLVERKENEPVTVKAPAMRDGNFKPFNFQFVEGGEIEIAGDKPKETPPALQLLVEGMESGKPYSHGELKAILRKKGKSDSAASNIISRAVAEGLIVKGNEGYTTSNGDLPLG